MQKVLISIDTEVPAGNIDSLIYGRTKNGKEYGIRYLMNLFDRHNAKGLFFVDLAEAWDYGEEGISKVVKEIKECGHDVGVHLHPDHMSDRNRRYLWQYSYDEQYEMISKCTELYFKITGNPPLSFRAGRYGANDETIKILENLEYKYDMSYFANNKYCKIQSNQFNRLFYIGNILEVTVTTFKSLSTPFYERYDKMDSGQMVGEFKRILRNIEENNLVDIASFFVHSFSFLNWRINPYSTTLDRRMEKRIKQNLRTVSESEFSTFISEADIEKISVSSYNDRELNCANGLKQYFYFCDRAFEVLKARTVRNV